MWQSRLIHIPRVINTDRNDCDITSIRTLKETIVRLSLSTIEWSKSVESLPSGSSWTKLSKLLECSTPVERIGSFQHDSQGTTPDERRRRHSCSGELYSLLCRNRCLRLMLGMSSLFPFISVSIPPSVVYCLSFSEFLSLRCSIAL